MAVRAVRRQPFKKIEYLGYLEFLKRGAHLLGNLGNSPDLVLFAAQPTDQREESVVLLLVVVIVVVGGGQFFSLPCTVFLGVKRQKNDSKRV